jgi:hypothetical protein
LKIFCQTSRGKDGISILGGWIGTLEFDLSARFDDEGIFLTRSISKKLKKLLKRRGNALGHSEHRTVRRPMISSLKLVNHSKSSFQMFPVIPTHSSSLALRNHKEPPTSLNLRSSGPGSCLLDPQNLEITGEFVAHKQSSLTTRTYKEQQQYQKKSPNSAYYQRLQTGIKPYLTNKANKAGINQHETTKNDNELNIRFVDMAAKKQQILRSSNIPPKFGKPLKIALKLSLDHSHVYTQHKLHPSLDIGTEVKAYGILPMIERGVIPKGAGLDIMMNRPEKQTIGDPYDLHDKAQVLTVTKSKIKNPAFELKHQRWQHTRTMPESLPFYLTSLHLAPIDSTDRKAEYPIARKYIESKQTSLDDAHSHVNSKECTSHQDYDMEIDQADLVTFYNSRVQTESPIFKAFCARNRILETETAYVLQRVCKYLMNYSVPMAEIKLSVIYKWASQVASMSDPNLQIEMIECVANKAVSNIREIMTNRLLT